MPYTPPSFAIPYDPSQANKRTIKTFEDGYWWVELGSEYDIIADQEAIRHKLMGYAHGVWDYIKNSGKYPEAADYALEWESPVRLSRLEIKCDTNLQCNIMMRKTTPAAGHHTKEVPPELLKALSAEARVDGKWVKLGSIDNNRPA